MILRFFDDGMALIICLNMMCPSLMLQKTADAEQLDDIHGSRKEKGNKKKMKYEERYHRTGEKIGVR